MTSKAFGLVQGESDPLSYNCTCEAAETGGSVLLFYRYWENNPRLSSDFLNEAINTAALAEWHQRLTEKYKLGGKIRIAREGYNITVAGTKANIDLYTDSCCSHWSFSGLKLDTDEARNKFFKPSPGCACVFNGGSSVRITSEITPMGVEGYIPQDWGKIESLSPEEFHERCYQEDILLMDVRNHYESKIGYFIDPKTGTVATRPPIRRFSQWPQYIKAHANDINGGKKKNIMTYCTGGIRCEKAVRWMQENTKQDDDTRIFTLEGGIAAYFDWMEGEIRTGRKQPKDSLFKGLNYVFDARASTRLTESTELVSRCHSCDQPTGHLAKCHSRRCHLVLVMCPDCNGKDVRCCLDCKQQDNNELAVEVEQKTSRGLCSCEREREYQLWGGEPVSKKSRKTAAKTSQKHKSGKSININVDVDPI